MRKTCTFNKKGLLLIHERTCKISCHLLINYVLEVHLFGHGLQGQSIVCVDEPIELHHNGLFIKSIVLPQIFQNTTYELKAKFMMQNFSIFKTRYLQWFYHFLGVRSEVPSYFRGPKLPSGQVLSVFCGCPRSRGI